MQALVRSRLGEGVEKQPLRIRSALATLRTAVSVEEIYRAWLVAAGAAFSLKMSTLATAAFLVV